MTSVIRPAARDDIIRQFRWYLVEHDASDVAFRFLDAVDESIGQLLRMPKMGTPRALKNLALEGLRMWPVEGFDEMCIFYQVQGNLLRVVRILHGKRDINRILESESAGDNIQ